MGRHRWLDESVVDVALEAVVAGATFKQAAAVTGLSATIIRVRFAERGLVRRREPQRRGQVLAPSVVGPALAAVARGVRVADAAAGAGIGVSTLRRRIREHGVVMLRPRHARADTMSLEDREE